MRVPPISQMYNRLCSRSQPIAKAMFLSTFQIQTIRKSKKSSPTFLVVKISTLSLFLNLRLISAFAKTSLVLLIPLRDKFLQILRTKVFPTLSPSRKWTFSRQREPLRSLPRLKKILRKPDTERTVFDQIKELSYRKFSTK